MYNTLRFLWCEYQYNLGYWPGTCLWESHICRILRSSEEKEYRAYKASSIPTDWKTVLELWGTATHLPEPQPSFLPIGSTLEMNDPTSSPAGKRKTGKGHSLSAGNSLRDVAKTQNGTRPSAQPVSLPSLLSPLNPEERLRAILNISLSDGTFYDTKFYLFSRRSASGRVDRPLGIFANSAILRAQSPYFTHCG